MRVTFRLNPIYCFYIDYVCILHNSLFLIFIIKNDPILFNINLCLIMIIVIFT